MFSWNSNGTLTLAEKEGIRFCILDTNAVISAVENISSGLSETGDIVFKATKISGKSLFNNLSENFPFMLLKFLGKHLKQLKHQIISDITSTLGYGRPHEITERGHGEIELVISNPFYPHASAGLITGMLESLTRLPLEARYEYRNRKDLVVSVFPSAKKSCTLALEPALPTVSGRNVFELCTACKTPCDLSFRFFFDTEQGEIQEIRNSGRVAFIDVACLRTILTEFGKKTDRDVGGLVLGLEKERVRNIFAREKAEISSTADEYMKYARTLRIRGMGNVSSASVSGRTAKIRVDNPYQEALVAAFIAGFHEAVTGDESVVEWTPPVRGTTYVSVFPK